MGNNTVLTETFFGSKIYVDSEDISLSPHIIKGGHWEPWVTEFLIRELRVGDVFLDIGANCGFFSLLASRLVKARGFVVAFEPQAKLAELLSNSLAVNGHADTSRVVAKAVGETAGTAHLGQVGNFRGSASLTPGFGEPHPDATDVSVVTLTEALHEIASETGRELRPTVIKIDVEGYEFNVWKGMQGVLDEAGSMVILMEFSPIRYVDQGQDPHTFIKEMREKGFSLSRLNYQSMEEDFDDAFVDELIGNKGYFDLVMRR
ncbi:FkbM family methyltransferase [Nitratireductor pacificus]|uniref:FkbM family methyltransferase n=1 Tax=Nitratireductor pacificus pht-3B TaxID=391937 RepID=K2MAR1_9HYPH|nr:FkbM family methyltransferase [Nitratireductor pacificus]EKF18040.1 FkbM family methyltransferase [Nitratireductor pacificus pht-3B]